MNIPLWPMLWITGIFNRKMHVCAQQPISLDKSDFRGEIIDLGGGGEGVIGQLMGDQVTAIDIREDELKDAPNGPKKVVADARALPFNDETFDCATAFYFLLYLKPEDYLLVFQEASRVLKRGGQFMIWDTVIPKTEKYGHKTYIVPVKIVLPNKKIQTAYGAPWKNRELNTNILNEIAVKAGLTLETSEEHKNSIVMVFVKN